MLLCNLLWLLFKWIIIHLNSCLNFVSYRVPYWGKWPSRTYFFFFFEKIKEWERDLFSGIFILKSKFFYVVKKYIPISYLEYLVFDATAANIYISKFIFLCVAYGQYPNMIWMLFFIYQKYWSFENVFSHGFLKHKKICFLAFLDFTTCL
jgi:hypothetical protein